MAKWWVGNYGIDLREFFLVMQSYINHLLEDIAAAQRPEQTEQATVQQTIEEHFEEVERWLANDPAFTFSYYCGLEKEIFPPADKLTEEQMQQVIKAYHQLLFSWNLSADIPGSLPIAKTYFFLITTLDKKTEIVNDGFITFEFCTCDPPSCPFEEFCTCKDLRFDDMDRNLPEKGELPF